MRRRGLLAAAAALTAGFVTAIVPATARAADFSTCPAGAIGAGHAAQCAVISVPRDYAESGGPRIDVTVSRIRAAGQRYGTIFANPGGPGADALDYWGARLAQLPKELTEHYDLVAVQPRGLRWSTPLTCGASIADDGQDGREPLQRACDKAQPGYLATITTENTARDIDSVRAALGLDRIDFLGISYGTYLGAVYASLFPRHVGRMVLDSNVDPQWVWTEQFAQQQLAGKQRLDDLFGWIAEHDSRYHLGDSPLRVYETWVRLVSAQGGGWYANLTPPPVSAADLPRELPPPLAAVAAAGLNAGSEQVFQAQNLVRTLTSGGTSAQVPLVSATTVASYTRGFWPSLAQAMAEANAQPSDLRRLRAIAGATTTDPTGQAVFAAVTCNENAVPARMDAIGSAAAIVASGGNALDARADLVRSGLACADWDPVATPVPVADHGLVTAPLILQSRHDAMTPYPGGPAMASALHGHLITVAGGDHGAFGRGNTPLDDAVLTYLRTGAVDIDQVDQAPMP
ncbi:alpha/beta hydrolase family protein [Nocardia nova SH22a]|uniref:Alpha/beta hydrolase family protein n=1 Tax=Nocardia nova SH22a TaxID=1415166 RepID=W5TTG6_9NOCA|nr:alpha/beta hydrolase [Nocardia nova]AHH22223.1 alpha/beta hydrolase family protein [Nocardia nova SH22a]